MSQEKPNDMKGIAQMKKRIVAILALGFVWLACVGAGSFLIRSQPLHAWKEALEPANRPASCTQLFTRLAAQPGGKDASLLCTQINLRAAETSPDAAHPLFAWKQNRITGRFLRTDPLPPDVAEALEKTMTDYASLFPQLHQAVTPPASAYFLALENRTDHDERSLWRLRKQVIRLAALSAIRAVWNTERQYGGAAVEAVADGIEVGRHLASIPMPAAYYGRSSTDICILRTIPRLLALGHLTDTQLSDLAGVISRIDYSEQVRLSIEYALASELEREGLFQLAWSHSFGETPSAGSPMRDVRLGDVALHFGEVLGLNWWNWFGVSDVESAYTACIANGIMSAARLPCAERWKQARVIDKAVSTSMRSRISTAFWDVSDTSHMLTRDREVMAFRNLALAAVAVERYRLAKGTAPEQLSDLVPGYLPEVPIDPFSTGRVLRAGEDGTQLLRYGFKSGVHCVYSVGWNGYDDFAGVTALQPESPYGDDFVWMTDENARV